MTEGGAHDRQRFVALTLGLHRAARTGLLEVRSGRRWRRLHLVGGRPALFSSSVAGERLSRALEDAGLIDRNALRGLAASELDEDGIARALVERGKVDSSEMRRQRTRLLERGIGASLGWDSGTWTFEDHGRQLEGRYDPSLLPPVHLPAALWAATRTVVHMEQVLPFISDAEAGPLVPGDRLVERMAELNLDGPLGTLADHLDPGGTPLDELFRRLPDRSGHLVVLLWMLELGGDIVRPNRSPDPELAALATGRDLPPAPAKTPSSRQQSKPAPPLEEEPIEVAAEPAPEPPPKKKKKAPAGRRMPARKLNELVRADHKHRVGKDFYAFLDLPPTASVDDIEATADQLRGPWDQAAEDDDVDPAVGALAKDLVAGANLVVKTLKDRRKRREYDKRLEAEDAPLVSGLAQVEPRAQRFSAPGAMAPTNPDLAPGHSEARRLIAQGDWDGAIRHLSPLRQEDPSDVEVLADLGWACWKSKRDPDFIRLAVTFDSSNPRALEYLGRVYAELGEDDKVARIARTLLKVDRTNPWAKKVRTGQAAGRSS